MHGTAVSKQARKQPGITADQVVEFSRYVVPPLGETLQVDHDHGGQPPKINFFRVRWKLQHHIIANHHAAQKQSEHTRSQRDSTRISSLPLVE